MVDGVMKHYPFASLGAADHGWLRTRYHFSFADYYDPTRMHFGALRVINDDLILPGQGFDPHPHKNMEIITYVRSGRILHRDSLGHTGQTGAGHVQVMSAGTGIIHSEFSDPTVQTELFQIWIFPREKGVAPRWDQAEFPSDPVTESLKLLVSGDPADAAVGALYIHQEAWIYGGRVAAGRSIRHPVHHQVYVVVADGSVEINGVTLQRGDGLEVTGVAAIDLQAGAAGVEILVIDVPA